MKAAPPTTQDQNVLYALHYQGKLLGTFKWTKSGPDYLYGWRPPKKIYFKVGQANCGVAHLPKEIQKDIEIVEYRPVESKALTYDVLAARIRKTKALISKEKKSMEWSKDSIKSNEKALVGLKHGSPLYYDTLLCISRAKEYVEKRENVLKGYTLDLELLLAEQQQLSIGKAVAKNSDGKLIGLQG